MLSSLMQKALIAKPIGASAREQNTSRTEKIADRRVTLSAPAFCDDPANDTALAKAVRAAHVKRVRVTVTESNSDTGEKHVSRKLTDAVNVFGKARSPKSAKRGVNRIASQLAAVNGS